MQEFFFAGIRRHEPVAKKFSYWNEFIVLYKFLNHICIRI
jgi:hypothetical protein